jgi:uridine kinase
MSEHYYESPEIDPRILNPEYGYTLDDPQFAQLVGHVAAQREASANPLSIVGISGFGGSGKSTLARSLASVLGKRLASSDAEAVPVIPIDDFYTGDQLARGSDWPGYNRSAFREVTAQLRDGEMPVSYQRYNWVTHEPEGKRAVHPVGGIVLAEGVGIFHPDTRGEFDLPVWVTIPLEEAVRSGIDRMGEEFRTSWETVWGPNDADFYSRHMPHDYARDHPAGFVFDRAG